METSLGKYARRFFSGTLLSRISGMGRDLAMAFAFGDHPSLAAFMVAFRLSNLFRRLLGEGPLQSAFIPHFEGLRAQDESQASFFFKKLALLISFIAITLTLLAEGGLISLLHFGNLSPENYEIVHLTAWLFPGLLFICLYGLNISLLNCYDSFFVPSVAPFVCNLIWIVAALLLTSYEPSLAMGSLAKWVVVGFIAQWLLTLPMTIKYAKGSIRDWISFTIPPEVKALFIAFSLGAIGVGAMQINAMADAFFARYADLRGPTYLWYSIRLNQLALAVFGIACVATITPRLSRAIKSGTFDIAQDLFSLGFKRVMAIMVPCTFVVWASGLAAVNLVYGRGNFSEAAVLKTYECLFAYCLGLVPTTLVMLYSAVYYARSNFRTPMLFSLAAVGINIVLNYLFVFVLDYGAVSTAISTSVSAWLNYWWLSWRQVDLRCGLNLSRVVHIVCSSIIGLLCSMLVAYVCFGIGFKAFLFGTYSLPNTTTQQLYYFLAFAISFLGGFLSFAFFTRNEEVISLFKSTLSQKVTN